MTKIDREWVVIALSGIYVRGQYPGSFTREHRISILEQRRAAKMAIYEIMKGLDQEVRGEKACELVATLASCFDIGRNELLELAWSLLRTVWGLEVAKREEITLHVMQFFLLHLECPTGYRSRDVTDRLLFPSFKGVDHKPTNRFVTVALVFGSAKAISLEGVPEGLLQLARDAGVEDLP